MEFCPYLYNLEYNNFYNIYFITVYVSMQQRFIDGDYFFTVLAQLLLIGIH